MSRALALTLAAAAIAIASAAGGAWVEHQRGAAKLAALSNDHSKAMAMASQEAQRREAKARADEQRITLRYMEAADAATVQAHDARAAAARADLRAGELRHAYSTVAAALADRVSEAAAAAAGGPTAEPAGLVLSELFGWAEGRLRSCAAALDQSLIAGRACERAHGATEPVNGAP